MGPGTQVCALTDARPSCHAPLEMLGALDVGYRTVGRHLLFRLDAERAHHLVAWGLGLLHRSPGLRRWVLPEGSLPPLEVEALGMHFRSPIGLAAGFDKAATMYNALGALGFGFVEVGTVTALAQPGNERPRLFRLKEDRALLNRMGFNNPGAEAVKRALEAFPPSPGLRLGVNLGKSKACPVETAAEDYVRSAELLAPFAQYLVLNVSSPNTPGLRSLQSVEALAPLVAAVRSCLARLPSAPPLLVKIAPDLADEDIDAVVDLALSSGVAGLVATNTTIGREGLGLRCSPEALHALGAGGLSGPFLRRRSLEVLSRCARRSKGRLTLVGVGGITTAEDVWETLRAGATLVQVYTALVYEGPSLAVRLHRQLAERLEREGFRSVSELVGTGL